MAQLRPFIHAGRSLTVKATPFDERWEVRVVENDNAVTDVVYTVADDTSLDATRAHLPAGVIDDLMTLAQKDVVEGRVALLPQAPR